MANWQILKAAIADVIKTNGNQEITGRVLQNVLNNIISNLGANATFANIATPSTNPGTPDGPVFYLATQSGTYSNFGGAIVENEAAILLYNGSTWVKKATGIALTESVLNLVAKSTIIDPQTLNSYNKIDPDRLILGKSIRPTNGSVYDFTGNFVSNFIDVLGVDKVYSQIYANGNIYAYDENFAFISYVPHSETEYTLSENTRYVRLTGKQSLIGGNSLYLYLKNDTTYYAYGITEDKIYTDEKMSDVEGIVDGVKVLINIRDTSNQYINKINYVTDFIDGIMINSRGKEQLVATACSSVFIDVLGLEKFYCSAYAYGSIYGYDDEMNFVKALPINGGGFSGAYLVEDGIRYVRISIFPKDNKNRVFFYVREEDLSVKTNMYNAYYYEYGITYTDLVYRKELDVVPTKLDAFHSMYINSINLFTTDIVEREGAVINSNGEIMSNSATTRSFYSKFIPVVGGKKLSSNISSYGSILAYDKDKKFLGVLSAWKSDARFKNFIKYLVLDPSVAYVRLSAPISNYDIYCLSIGEDLIYRNDYHFGETFDSHYKYRGKKLVTIGDSITYQRTWQDRLCELTGLWHNPKEVRGADEGVKTEGYGYILLTSGNEDTDTYYEEVEGISKSDETVVDGFGYAHPIWADSEGNKYRQPCRTAEGGETVMPVNTTSIYSRASDSKYYKGDVVIVFAGANDKVTYINKYPTYGDLSNIQGLTNLKDGTEDTTEATFEIYKEDAVLTADGDYSDVEEVTGIKKYNHTFRACFRGLLKKVVDANPNAQIIVIGPFATMIKTYDYISRGYDYLTIEENKVIEECAREFGCQYINLYPLFGRYGADRYFRGTDGTVYIHPTNEGGLKIAEYIASQIM
jgi:hypothetical protein